jgi:hypothetical protein
MICRSLQSEDLPKLQAIAAASGYPYPDLSGPDIEAVQVVVDEDGNVLGACAAKKVIELYLYKGLCPSPACTLSVVRNLHKALADDLRSKGWNEANVFLPPALVKSFGRRLEKSFSWVRNWPSWARRF